MRVCWGNPGHMTNLTATPKYDKKKTFKNLPRQNNWLISKKLGMQHTPADHSLFD